MKRTLPALILAAALSLRGSALAEEALPAPDLKRDEIVKKEVLKLLEQAEQRMRTAHFQEVIELSRKALTVAPRDLRAQELLEAAKRGLEQGKLEAIEQVKMELERAQMAAKKNEWKAQIDAALDRRVSFDFVETPLEECIAFLNAITKTNMVIDPKIVAGGAPTINLRVTDMPIRDALSWICRLVDIEFQVRDQAVFFTRPAKKGVVAERGMWEVAVPGPHEDVFVDLPGIEPPKFVQKQGQDAARLRVKWATGAEIEVNGAFMTEMPQVVQDLIEQFEASADDRLLAYRMKLAPAKLEPIRQSIAQFAPEVKLDYNEALGVLVVTGEPAQLRRAAAILREVRAAAAPKRPVAADVNVKALPGMPGVKGEVRMIGPEIRMKIQERQIEELKGKLAPKVEDEAKKDF